MNTSAYTAGLRELADFLDEHPEALEHAHTNGFDFDLWADSRDELVALARELGGSWEKGKLGGFYELSRRFGPHRVVINVSESAVCERVVVGTEKVQIPDPDAPLVEVEREIVAWRCPPILAGS